MGFVRGLGCLLVFVGALSGVGCSTISGDAGSSVDVTLTAEQQAAIDSVVEQVEAMAVSLAGVVDSFDGVEAEANTSFGECPVIDVSLLDGIATLTLTFPDGCTNEYYGDAPVSGGITVVFDTVALSFAVTFDDFVTNVGTVTGTMTLGFVREGVTVALAGTIDIGISGVGSAQGDITVQFNADDSTITVASASVTLDAEEGDSFTVGIDGLVVDPIGNGNFVPESGSVSFDVPNDGAGPETIAIVVTFDENSPVDGTVSVSVGGSDPIDYQIGVAG